MFKKTKFYCPGPTPVPIESSLSSIVSPIYHRSEAFFSIFRECRGFLKNIFHSPQEPLILSGSGTAAMEAAVVNLTSKGDEVLVINAGKFGERWQKLNRAFGCQVHVIEVDWGMSVQKSQLVDKLNTISNLKAVFFQANETSTGAVFDVPMIACEVKRVFPESLVVVDAISSLCAHEMQMEKWGIDCVVGGAQKGFGIPPGISFIALSKKAVLNFSDRDKFYFSLETEIKNQSKGATSFTPSISLIQGLHVVLKEVNSIGIECINVEHEKRAKAVRLAAKAMNLELFSEQSPSSALTVMKTPPSIDATEVIEKLYERYAFIFAGGQEQLKGKVIRFSHLGMMDAFDVISGVAALELVLSDCGHQFSCGDGVKAAVKSFSE